MGVWPCRCAVATRAAVDRVLAALRARLEATPGFAGFTALPAVRAPGDWPGRQELDDFSTSSRSSRSLRSLSALVLISSTMTTLVSEQAREIATMKAIGARRRQIVGIYARTALLLGALGTLIGSVLGVILANLLVGFFGREFFAIEPGLGVDAAGPRRRLRGRACWARRSRRCRRSGAAAASPVREALQDTGASAGAHGRLEAAVRTRASSGAQRRSG